MIFNCKFYLFDDEYSVFLQILCGLFWDAITLLGHGFVFAHLTLKLCWWDQSSVYSRNHFFTLETKSKYFTIAPGIMIWFWLVGTVIIPTSGWPPGIASLILRGSYSFGLSDFSSHMSWSVYSWRLECDPLDIFGTLSAALSFLVHHLVLWLPWLPQLPSFISLPGYFQASPEFPVSVLWPWNSLQAVNWYMCLSISFVFQLSEIIVLCCLILSVSNTIVSHTVSSILIVSCRRVNIVPVIPSFPEFDI